MAQVEGNELIKSRYEPTLLKDDKTFAIPFLPQNPKDTREDHLPVFLDGFVNFPTVPTQLLP